MTTKIIITISSRESTSAEIPPETESIDISIIPETTGVVTLQENILARELISTTYHVIKSFQDGELTTH